MTNNIKRILAYLPSLFAAIIFLSVEKTLAVCPVCTVAVGTGVGLSRYFGIDDTISGLWIGGLIVSIITWTENWLEKKNVRFKGRIFLSALVYYAAIIIPLYLSGIIGHPQNTLICFCGLNIDKILFGIITGSVAFWFGVSWHFYLKEKNKGRAHFPFQKVIIPVATLIILSLIFYFLIK